MDKSADRSAVESHGDEPIRRALDLSIWSERLYWRESEQNGHRWPASAADAYASPDRYRGTIPELQMGSLLALPRRSHHPEPRRPS